MTVSNQPTVQVEASADSQINQEKEQEEPEP